MTQEKIALIEAKRIVLGVTGSIAAYKAIDLASKLTQAGAVVDVITTEAARQFVTPLSFQSVTGRPVYTDLWQPDSSGGLPTHIAHVGLGEGADLLLIAPATANTIAKLAHGLADDLLSVTALAVRCPVMIAPAMDGGMYQHAATQANLSTLQSRGVQIIEPEVGRFASGLVGQGRLPETPTLLGLVRRRLAQNGLLAGKRVVVTAGGTKEAIDPVRYITNRSSGKQGYTVTQAALDAGAEVTLISTVDYLPVPAGAVHIKVGSAAEMLAAVQQAVVNADGLIMAAAVADFRPATVATQKIKKSDGNQTGLTLELARTDDILLAVKSIRQQTGYPRCVVGFAAESHDLLTHAASKLERKGLNFIVANDITAPDAGFEVETNRITILDEGGGQKSYELLTKAQVGQVIVEQVAKILIDKSS
ncbi:MAG: bifunctional phosphopantothenoylcysteine decarboxylase/phosphopantothenate--cysteine ligase CoaBC [Chloroflexi bacterium]|nr:bifunctional phosphopantothenoylcysteine decarboxylase/phosphopantothenate--cysteine ligase CoaBC [Chloroflexota bacterium]